MTRLIRLPAVLDITGLSRSKVYELLATDQFVRPTKLSGGRINAWSTDEIEAWVRARLDEREAA